VVLCPEKIVPPLGLMAGIVSVLQPEARKKIDAMQPQTSRASRASDESRNAQSNWDRNDASILQDHWGQQVVERTEAH
jgi:hypothetical protein